MKRYHLNVKSDFRCEEDQLGFGKYVDTLSGMITDEDFKTPFCIGIFGKWGSGKTSFMHLLEKKLLDDNTPRFAIPVWFNPWRYEREEHLIIPFLKTIERGIRKFEEDHKKGSKKIEKKLSGKLLEFAATVGKVSAAFAYGITADAKLGGFGLRLDASKMAKREEELSSRRMKELRGLSEEYSSIYYEITKELQEAVDENVFRIVVFVDDLDRCLPDKAVELLEAIKLFLDIEGYLFVIGVDREVVKKGISYRYRHFEFKDEERKDNTIISPEDYLDKMIQLPLELPVIERGRKESFIKSLMGKSDDFKEHSDLIIYSGIGENPRSLKRFINLLAFMVNLAETLKESICCNSSEESPENKAQLEKYFIPILYIKWTIIVFRYQEDYNAIKGNPKRLIEIQEAAKEKEEPGETEHKSTEITRPPIDGPLRRILLKGEQFPDNDWLIERFIHLTESTVVSKVDKAKSTGFARSFTHGEMVNIPKGIFLHGEDKTEKNIDYDYEIDVYQVTNKQYKEFVDETGHEIPYSDDENSKQYSWDKSKCTYPEGLENHPVVFVSYDDAIAFCKWRSEKEKIEVRLPTEEEWEKAARGRDGREYPWGNEFDFNKLNCADYHVKKELRNYDEWKKEFRDGFFEKNKTRTLTTEVGKFTDSTSPFGCYDMAGNVWEWTSSKYAENSFVLRGGSWIFISSRYRCAYRLDNEPFNRLNSIGFRCARTLTL